MFKELILNPIVLEQINFGAVPETDCFLAPQTQMLGAGFNFIDTRIFQNALVQTYSASEIVR